MLTSTYTIPSYIYGKLFLLSAFQADFLKVSCCLFPLYLFIFLPYNRPSWLKAGIESSICTQTLLTQPIP